MSLKFLGDVIDIHTGGIDLRFPHHEDERAQSNSLAGHEVVRHWVHGEHVLFEGRKMAKSTGNVVLLSDLAARGLDPLAARLAFLEHRYRQQMNLTWETLTAADGTVRRWREQVADWANEPSKPMCAEYWARITAAPGRRPGHPGGPAGAARAGQGPADPARLEVRDIRQRRPGPRPRPGQPGRTSRGRWHRCRPARRPCWPSGPRPGSGRTSPPRTGCARARRARRRGRRHAGRPDLDVTHSWADCALNRALCPVTLVVLSLPAQQIAAPVADYATDQH